MTDDAYLRRVAMMDNGFEIAVRENNPREAADRAIANLERAGYLTAKAKRNPGPSLFHDFGCTHDPCRCKGDNMRTTHTPIAVPCEDLDLILKELGQDLSLPGDVVRAIERVRGRFPADWQAAEAPDHPVSIHTYTNYEAVVSDSVRSHTAELMQDWIDAGRPDARIGDLVKSLVLNAYASGQRDEPCDFDHPHSDHPCGRETR